MSKKIIADYVSNWIGKYAKGHKNHKTRGYILDNVKNIYNVSDVVLQEILSDLSIVNGGKICSSSHYDKRGYWETDFETNDLEEISAVLECLNERYNRARNTFKNVSDCLVTWQDKKNKITQGQKYFLDDDSK